MGVLVLEFLKTVAVAILFSKGVNLLITQTFIGKPFQDFAKSHPNSDVFKAIEIIAFMYSVYTLSQNAALSKNLTNKTTVNYTDTIGNPYTATSSKVFLSAESKGLAQAAAAVATGGNPVTAFVNGTAGAVGGSSGNEGEASRVGSGVDETIKSGANPYYKDTVNESLRSKIQVAKNGTITVDKITISGEGVDLEVVKSYAKAAEEGWTEISLDIDVVKSGGDLRLLPCDSDCSIHSIDGGYLGAAEVGGTKLYYGKSQYIDTPVHETGHILGLSHQGTQAGSIMSGSANRAVNTSDLSRLRSLYE